MSMQQYPAKMFAAIIRATFPDYRKKTVMVWPMEKVELHGLNWEGGSRAEYRLCTLDGLHVAQPVATGAPPPWANPYEGLEVPVIPGTVVVRGGHFCGKVAQLYIYVNPENMPALLPPAVEEMPK